jgi:hypothetical protein
LATLSIPTKTFIPANYQKPEVPESRKFCSWAHLLVSMMLATLSILVTLSTPTTHASLLPSTAATVGQLPTAYFENPEVQKAVDLQLTSWSQ